MSSFARIAHEWPPAERASLHGPELQSVAVGLCHCKWLPVSVDLVNPNRPEIVVLKPGKST